MLGIRRHCSVKRTRQPPSPQHNNHDNKNQLFLKHRKQFQKLKNIFKQERQYSCQSRLTNQRIFFKGIQDKHVNVFTSVLKKKKNKKKLTNIQQNNDYKSLGDQIECSLSIKNNGNQTKFGRTNLIKNIFASAQKTQHFTNNHLSPKQTNKSSTKKLQNIQVDPHPHLHPHSHLNKHHIHNINQLTKSSSQNKIHIINSEQNLFSNKDKQKSTKNPYLKDRYPIHMILLRPVAMGTRSFFEQKKARKHLLQESQYRLKSEQRQNSISPWLVNITDNY